MKFITTDKAPIPAGHYSQAVIHNGIVYISGQLPIIRGSGKKEVLSIEEQTRQTLTNLAAVLKASGSDISQVLRTTVYIADISLWDQINTVYADFFGPHKPARSIVPTRELHFGFQIEIDAIAVVTSN